MPYDELIGVVPYMTSALETHLTAALRGTRHHKLSYFYSSLLRHRKHPSFQIQDWPFSRELGFACECSGGPREWRVGISTLQETLPEARAAFMRFRSSRARYGRKAIRREHRRADRKARDLLHRFLTREQKWSLRATKSFDITGKDGRTYRLNLGRGFSLIENGKPRYSLCAVPKEISIPAYDLTLAHKVLLETDPEGFLRIAHASDLETHEVYHSADFITQGTKPIPNEVTEEAPWVIHLPDEVLDNPEPWVREQLEDRS